LRPKARGCRASEATLGKQFHQPANLNGVVHPVWVKRVDAYPKDAQIGSWRTAIAVSTVMIFMKTPMSVVVSK